jgi:hypothetical protein
MRRCTLWLIVGISGRPAILGHGSAVASHLCLGDGPSAADHTLVLPFAGRKLAAGAEWIQDEVTIA